MWEWAKRVAVAVGLIAAISLGSIGDGDAVRHSPRMEPPIDHWSRCKSDDPDCMLERAVCYSEEECEALERAIYAAIRAKARTGIR